METFYLIDFENVHNDGIANIESMTKEEHVHIFSTQNATNIRQDIFWLKEDRDIKPHLVPVRKQSLDMHLVSYLGYLLGVYGKECSYVIISKDKDYDNIVKFWKEEEIGIAELARISGVPERTILDIMAGVKEPELGVIIETTKTDAGTRVLPITEDV